MNQKQYGRLVLMFVIHFALMYVLMYAMLASFSHAYTNLDQFYMAALMASPMVVLELWLMRSMYPNKEVNVMLMIAALGIFLLSFYLIRGQVGVSDRALLRAMIPHHSAAIHMCEEAGIKDGHVQQFCDIIIAGQQDEIEWMEQMLQFLDQPEGAVPAAE